MEYRDAMDAVEVEADASIVKDGKTDGESRERLELRDKSLVGEFQSAALGGRSVVGAELEYSQAMGCPAGHMPLTIAGTGSGANTTADGLTLPGADLDDMGEPLLAGPILRISHASQTTTGTGFSPRSCSVVEKCYPLKGVGTWPGGNVVSVGGRLPARAGRFRERKE